jgi:AraC-like DNA-binding protein
MRIQGDNFGKEITFKSQLHDRKYTYPRHIHQFAELIFVTEGKITVSIDGNPECINAGEAALIFPFQAHGFHSKDRVKMAMYLFSPSIAGSFFKNHDGKVGERAVFSPAETTKLLHEARILCQDELSLYSVKSFIYSVLADYTAQVKLIDGFSDTTVATKVASYINEHFSEPINLESVAKAIGYSPNYLSHCIGRVFGFNFCSLLANLRIDKARKLLSETDKTTIEICYECGFGSERSFHRQFKSVTGKTPSDYRASFACGAINPPKTVHFK